MRHRLIVLLLVLAACGSEPVDVGGSRPEPAQPSEAPVVGTTSIQDTSFALHDEGDGCLAITIEHPGLQSTVERHCFSGQDVLALTYPCGWLAEPPAGKPVGCDVTLPRVFYGQVRDATVAHVCVGMIMPPGGVDGVTSARFLDIGDSGFILEAQQQYEQARAHLFTRGGVRYGEPPLPEQSGAIYQLCEAHAPWGAAEGEVLVELAIRIGTALQNDGVMISLDGGVGALGFDGDSTENGEIADFPVRVPVTSTQLRVQIESESGVTTLGVAWPARIQSLLDQEAHCTQPLELILVIENSALQGDPQGVRLSVVSANC